MNWESVKLGSLGEFRNGLNYSKENEGEGLKVISVKNFGDLRVPNYVELDEINPDGVNTKDSRLEAGDIIFVRSNGNKDLIGRSMYIEETMPDVSYSGFCIRFRNHSPNVRSKFLAYYFRSPLFRRTLSNLGGGTNINNLNQTVLKNFEISVPNPAEQEKILTTISSYDDLIENNRRRIALLEEAARLLYREWFVHFRFPGHEHVKIIDGVPAGWSKGTIDDLFNTSSGGTPSRQKPEYYGGNINWLKTQEMNGGYVFDTHEKITDEGLKGSSAKLFPKNTVVVAMYGATIGQLCILANPSTTNQACCALLPKIDEKDFLFGYALMDQSAKALKDRGQGAAQNNISQQVIKAFEILVPARDLISGFNQLLEPMFEQRKILEGQATQLIKARDLLLPRLMDGRLEV